MPEPRHPDDGHRNDGRRAAERVARACYGRLLALLASRSRDIAAAEDAMAGALATALERWPSRGVPDNPEAWLLTVARRTLGDGRRRQRVRHEAEASVLAIEEGLAAARAEAMTRSIPDTRLALMFVCAHPAIDAAVRTPLMLQTVLGIESARIAGAFVVAPATMAQRLVRAKTKIRDAAIRFALPDLADLPGRLDAVLDAVYAAYRVGWDGGDGGDGVADRRPELAGEAIHLAEVLSALLPDEPEVRGLLALLLHCEARRGARRTPDRRYAPLRDQAPAAWSRDLIRRAEQELREAARHRRPGRFQLEAAIQSAHLQAALTGDDTRAAIALLYDRLVDRTGSLGARVASAAAHGRAFGASAGLALLEAIDPAEAAAYQPFRATRAHLLAGLGRGAEAALDYAAAAGLAGDPALRAWLLERRDAALAAQAVDSAPLA